MDRLDDINWMESSSKQMAIQKVKQIVDKVGYPSWMTNDDLIDQRYVKVSNIYLLDSGLPTFF